MWQTVSARIRGTKSELEALGEETDNVMSSSKLRDLVKGYTGVDIMLDENTYKDIYTIVKEIGDEWKNLNDIDQAALLEALAGKKQSNTLAAVLNNADRLEEIYETAENSAGSAQREQEKYTQSLQYSLDQLTAHGEEFWTTFINTDDVKSFINLINDLIKAATVLVDTFGSIPTLAAGFGIFKGIQNFESIKEWINKTQVAAGAITGLGFSDDIAILELYKKQLQGLTLTQQKLALSSSDLTEAQQAKVLSYMQETAAVGTVTAATLAELETKELEVLTSAGVIGVNNSQATSEITVTAAQVQQIMATKLLDETEKKRLITKLGLIGAEKAHVGIIDLLKSGFMKLINPIKKAWASTEGMGGSLKRLGGTAGNLWKNMSVKGKIGIIAALVVAISKTIDYFTDSTEDIKARIDETKQKIQETESQISSLDSQVSKTESLIQKMKDAGADDSTIATYEKEKELLEDQKQILEEIIANERVALAADSASLINNEGTQSGLSKMLGKLQNFDIMGSTMETPIVGGILGLASEDAYGESGGYAQDFRYGKWYQPVLDVLVPFSNIIPTEDPSQDVISETSRQLDRYLEAKDKYEYAGSNRWLFEKQAKDDMIGAQKYLSEYIPQIIESRANLEKGNDDGTYDEEIAKIDATLQKYFRANPSIAISAVFEGGSKNFTDLGSLLLTKYKDGAKIDDLAEIIESKIAEGSDEYQKLIEYGFISKIPFFNNDWSTELAAKFVERYGKGKNSSAAFSNANSITMSEMTIASGNVKYLNSALEELRSEGYITTQTLSDIQAATKLSGDEWEEYKEKLMAVKPGSSETSQIMSELTDIILDEVFAGKDVNSLKEEEIALILKENGVVNASVVAHDLLRRKKAELNVESLYGQIGEDNFAESIKNVATECGLTTDVIADMMLKMINLNGENLDLSQQIEQIKKLRRAMNLPELDEASLGVVEVSGGYTYNGKQYSHWQEAVKQALYDNTSKAFTQQIAPEFEDELGAISNKLKDLNSILEGLDDGGLDSDSIEKIITKYRDLIGYIGDESRLREELKKKIAEEEAEYKQALRNKVVASSSFAQLVESKNETLFKKLGLAYDKDTQKFKFESRRKAAAAIKDATTAAAAWAQIYADEQVLSAPEYSKDLHDSGKNSKYRDKDGNWYFEAFNDGNITTYKYEAGSDMAKILDSEMELANISNVDIDFGNTSKSGSDKNEALDNYLEDAERRYKIHQDETKYIQELEYACKNLTKSEKERLDVADKINEAYKDLADNQIKDLKHQIDLAKELHGDDVDVTDYYDQIQNVASKEANRLRAKGYDDNSDEIQDLQKTWWDAQNEKLDFYTKQHENIIRDIEHARDMALEQNPYLDTTSYYKQMQAEYHKQAEYLRALDPEKYKEDIQDLQEAWWEAQRSIADWSYSNSERWINERNTYNDWELYGDSEVEAWERVLERFKTEFPNELEKIKDIEQKIFEARKEAMEKSISDIEDYISARNHFNDWDSYGDSELDAIQRQIKAVEKAYKDGLISIEEYIDKLDEYSQRIYSLGQEEVNKHLSNIDKYIDARNHYNDWGEYGDTEIEAIRRQCKILDEAYKQNLISLEEYTEKSEEYAQKLYSVAKNNIIETISELIEDYEEMKQDETDALNFESKQYGATKTLLQSYYDVTNAITEAQHEINKELRASQSMYEYLNEETRELLFNQEDYNILSEELLDIQTAANELQKQYEEDILGATKETIDEITSQYQMQYETMMKKYEIAKAELDVAKKRQKLDNVLAEHNVRMFINGQWQWVANTQNVIDAQKELADAEIEREQKETSLKQIDSINKLTEAQDDITTQINYIETDLEQIRDKWAKMQEMLDGESDEVAEVLREISQVSSPELQRVIEATGGSLDSFSTSLSESIKAMSTVVKTELSTGIGDIVTELENYADAIKKLVKKIDGLDVDDDDDKDDEDNDEQRSVEDIISEMKANSAAWHTASESEKEYLEERNQYLGGLIDADYNPETGEWTYPTTNSQPSSSSGSSSSNKVNTKDQFIVDSTGFLRPNPDWDGKVEGGIGSSSSKNSSSGGSSSSSGSSSSNKGSSNSSSSSSGSSSNKVNTKDQYVSDSTGHIQSNPNWDGKDKGGIGSFYEHADGTRYTPGGLTLMGEEGFEAFITNNGRLIPINQPTIGNIGAGGIVFNREQMANLRNLWDLSNLGSVSPFISSGTNNQSTVIDNSIHINGLTVGEQGNEDWINGLRRYVATHK